MFFECIASQSFIFQAVPEMKQPLKVEDESWPKAVGVPHLSG